MSLQQDKMEEIVNNLYKIFFLSLIFSYAAFSVNFLHSSEKMKDEETFFNNITNDNFREVKNNLRKNPELRNYQSKKEGYTGLMIAAQNNCKTILEWLVLQGRADVNLQDKRGWTALMFAIQNKKRDLVGILLKAGADYTNLLNDSGQSAFEMAKNNNYQVILRLMDEFPQKEDDPYALISAVNYDDLERVQELVESWKKTMLGFSKLLVKDDKGQSALDIAMSEGYLDIAEFLISQPAFSAHELLISALKEDKVEIINSLIALGKINIDSQTNEKDTLLMYASAHNAKDIVSFLIERGAYVNATNNKGQTALDVVALNDANIDTNIDTNIVTELLEEAGGKHGLVVGVSSSSSSPESEEVALKDYKGFFSSSTSEDLTQTDIKQLYPSSLEEVSEEKTFPFYSSTFEDSTWTSGTASISEDLTQTDIEQLYPSSLEEVSEEKIFPSSSSISEDSTWTSGTASIFEDPTRTSGTSSTSEDPTIIGESGSENFLNRAKLIYSWKLWSTLFVGGVALGVIGYTLIKNYSEQISDMINNLHTTTDQ